MPSEPGKCFAKCLVQESSGFQTNFILIPQDSTLFTNLCDSTEVDIPASQKWIKKKADKNCLSSDPNECLVWCLVETPSSTVAYFECQKSDLFTTAYLKNPDSFHIKEQIAKQVPPVEGGFTEWREVICASDPEYENTVRKVKQQLEAKGYYVGVIDSQMGAKTKAALVKFQRNNNLPLGNLDAETVNALNNPSLASRGKFCQFKTSRSIQDTIEYEGYFYIGEKLQKLEFADYVNLSKIKGKDYDSNNHRHATLLNNQFRKLLKKSPEDFGTRKNTVIYDINEEPLECLCPSDENIPTIQSQVEEALTQLGYETDGSFGTTTKRSLAQYQISNDKPIGFLDLKTLDLLGVKY